MYGAIIGDLAGSIYEYDQLNNVHSVKMNNLIEENSFYSDDTILTIATIDAILHGNNYEYYYKKYINEYKDYKPDYKPYFDNAFSPSIIRWSNSIGIGESCGNGAMMRISPIGYMFDKEADVIDNTMKATMTSHYSLDAINSALIISLIIFYTRKGLNKDEIFKMLNLKLDYTPFEKFNKTCEDTLNNCLYTYYMSNSFEDAIKKTLEMGGDTDTNCAIVGSMAEALYGIDESLIEKANKKLPIEFVKVLKRIKK